MSEQVLPKRVLVGVSLSDNPFDPDLRIVQGDVALVAQARWYAQKTGASLTFFHAIEGPDAEVVGTETTIHAAIRERAEPLLQHITQLSQDLGVTADYRLETGIASERLLQTASNEKYDLLMVCFHRDESALDRLFHGSTSKRLLRYCPIPVWVASPHDATPSLDKLLVPVDFSSASVRCIELCNAIAGFTGAERYLLHALEYPGAMAASLSPGGEEEVQAYRKSIRKEAKKKIDALLGAERDHWHVFLVDHPIAKQMKLFCEQKEIDLVVMGTVARTGLAGFFMGNTAERILAALDVPVLALKPEGWRAT
ncbi:MAG: universal stress protein [Myxococcales bacterium]|nr:universal stress protein [Myxococcales bacterium]MCB9644649.1 universal stress protein [Myxococcales bacterium]